MTTSTDLTDQTTLVVGASRGLGHGIVTALAETGVPVIAVSRTPTEFPDTVRTVVADAVDPTLPATLLDRYQPTNIVLVAGASPHMRPLQQQTWETFAVNWDTDVRLTFQWLRESLFTPLRAGGKVIVFSSGAAIGGSPLSGGYAGAKATQRFIAGYAQGEADRTGLAQSYTVLMPGLTPGHSGPAAPLTGVGEPATKAYAARAGLTFDQFVERMGPLLTPELTARAVLELLRADTVSPVYWLSSDGLREMS